MTRTARTFVALFVSVLSSMLGSTLIADGAAADAGDWACRPGQSQAGEVLDVSGTVCARRNRATWQGRTTLTLTSHDQVVDGTAYLLFEVLPVDVRFDIASVPIHLEPRQQITVPLTLDAATTPTDEGGRFVASIMANWLPGYGSGPGAELVSPIARATGSAAQPSRSTARSEPACVRTALTYATGRVTYCVRQVGNRLRGSGSITYRTQPGVEVFLSLGQSTNSDQCIFPYSPEISARVASASVQLPPSTGWVTRSLPALDSQLLTSDRTALGYVMEGFTPVVSKLLTVR